MNMTKNHLHVNCLLPGVVFATAPSATASATTTRIIIIILHMHHVKAVHGLLLAVMSLIKMYLESFYN
jgi:hypothetical protein